jgi:hypothetical protein
VPAADPSLPERRVVVGGSNVAKMVLAAGRIAVYRCIG